MISIEQVTCFTTVYELQSYSAASVQLNKARSTVRERINTLEDLMGVELFTIEGKKAQPTSIAHRLYPRARLLARQSLEFENIAFSAYKGELSRISIYHDSSTPVQLLALIDSSVKQKHNEIAIDWLQKDRNESLKRVEDGDAFIAIMPGLGNLHPTSGVGNINLGTCELGLFTSQSSSLPDGPLSIAELSVELQLITENDRSNGLRHTNVSCHSEIVSSKTLLIEKLKQSGWTVSAKADMQPYIDKGEIRQLNLIEAPELIRQDCVLFYNLSSEASELESDIIATIAQIAKNYLKR